MQSAVEMQMQQPASPVINASIPCNAAWRSSAVDFKNSDIYDYAVHFLDHIGIHRIDKLDL